MEKRGIRTERGDMKAWKQERDTKTTERKRLYAKYEALKNETAKVEKIRKSVYEIMRDETRRTQPTRTRGMEL